MLTSLFIVIAIFLVGSSFLYVGVGFKKMGDSGGYDKVVLVIGIGIILFGLVRIKTDYDKIVKENPSAIFIMG